MHAYAHTYIGMHTYTCTYIQRHKPRRACIINTCIHTHKNIHTHIHLNTYLHTYTYIHHSDLGDILWELKHKAATLHNIKMKIINTGLMCDNWHFCLGLVVVQRGNWFLFIHSVFFLHANRQSNVVSAVWLLLFNSLLLGFPSVLLEAQHCCWCCVWMCDFIFFVCTLSLTAAAVVSLVCLRQQSGGPSYRTPLIDHAVYLAPTATVISGPVMCHLCA